MATYTTNYNLEKPAQTDIYNVDVFNANADKIDAGLTDKAEKTMLAPVETTNSASRSYAKGEYFVYNNVLCCATTAIAAGGTIAIGTNCATAPVGGELTALRESLSTLTASLPKYVYTSTFTGNVSNYYVQFNVASDIGISANRIKSLTIMTTAGWAGTLMAVEYNPNNGVATCRSSSASVSNIQISFSVGYV